MNVSWFEREARVGQNSLCQPLCFQRSRNHAARSSCPLVELPLYFLNARKVRLQYMFHVVTCYCLRNRRSCRVTLGTHVVHGGHDVRASIGVVAIITRVL